MRFHCAELMLASSVSASVLTIKQSLLDNFIATRGMAMEPLLKRKHEGWSEILQEVQRWTVEAGAVILLDESSFSLTVQ